MTDQTQATDTAPSAMAALYTDLALAQADFADPKKTKINPAFKSAYADLSEILSCCRKALNAHGLALIQKVGTVDGGVVVETVLLHKSGATLSSGPLVVPIGRAQNMAQAFGSARTYACRYSLSSFLGIAADDDDDGNGAKGAPAPAPSPAPVPAKPLDLKPSEDLIKAATAAAEKGMDAYKAFYAAQKNIDKKRLYSGPGGWHKKLQEIAREADKKAAPQAAEASPAEAPFPFDEEAAA